MKCYCIKCKIATTNEQLEKVGLAKSYEELFSEYSKLPKANGKCVVCGTEQNLVTENFSFDFDFSIPAQNPQQEVSELFVDIVKVLNERYYQINPARPFDLIERISLAFKAASPEQKEIIFNDLLQHFSTSLIRWKQSVDLLYGKGTDIKL